MSLATAIKPTVTNTLTITAHHQSMNGNDILVLAMEDYDDHDIEAFILNTLGDIAHHIVRNFPNERVPASWDFRLGAGGAEDAETLFAQEIEGWGVSYSQLCEAGNALNSAFESLNS